MKVVRNFFATVGEFRTVQKTIISSCDLKLCFESLPNFREQGQKLSFVSNNYWIPTKKAKELLQNYIFPWLNPGQMTSSIYPLEMCGVSFKFSDNNWLKLLSFVINFPIFRNQMKCWCSYMRQLQSRFKSRCKDSQTRQQQIPHRDIINKTTSLWHYPRFNLCFNR